MGVGRRSEDVEPVEAEHNDQRADECAENVELAVSERGRAEEDRGEGGQQIGIGGAGRAAAKTRGEQGPREGGADAGNDKAQDLDAIDADAGEPGRDRVAAYRLDLLTDRCAFDQRPQRRHHQGHHDDRVGNAEQPTAQRQLQKTFRDAGDDRRAGRIGEGEPDDDRADAERCDH